MEQHITTFVGVCALLVAAVSGYAALSAARAARAINRMELIRRRFDVLNAVVRLHARLMGWDKPGKEITEITPEVESAFVDFNIAVAQAEVLFPKDAPIREQLDRIARDAIQIAVDRREPLHLKELLSVATVEQQLALVKEKLERTNRFYLSALPEFKESTTTLRRIRAN
jgi:hypothetical protein